MSLTSEIRSPASHVRRFIDGIAPDLAGIARRANAGLKGLGPVIRPGYSDTLDFALAGTAADHRIRALFDPMMHRGHAVQRGVSLLRGMVGISGLDCGVPFEMANPWLKKRLSMGVEPLEGEIGGSGANFRFERETAYPLRHFQAERTAFQTVGIVMPLRRMSTRLNWPFRMRCISSMPEITTAAFRKRLKPSIALILDLMLRWSCSIMLLRYFDDRNVVLSGNNPSAFISRTAR